MTYNVFGGTLNLAQSVSHQYVIDDIDESHDEYLMTDQ